MDSGYLQLQADPIYLAILNAIKELSAKEKAQKARLEELEEKNAELEERLERLEEALLKR